MEEPPSLTHIALHVGDLQACIGFYRDYAGLNVVHDRTSGKKRVVWLAEAGRESEFILVVLPGGPGRNQSAEDFSHLGFALESREAVDRIAARAETAGILVWPPREEPYPVGYYCGIRDPDGNFVEFSYGQPLGPGGECRRPALQPFHLAIEVRDLGAAREFYGDLLGCPEGRSAATWVDFDFFGHQLVCHVGRAAEPGGSAGHNAVDGDTVPIPHFGAVFDMPRWRSLADKLERAGVAFIIEPRIRFRGQPGEQGTLFFRDPDGHAIEFKGFADIGAQLFAKQDPA